MAAMLTSDPLSPVPPLPKQVRTGSTLKPWPIMRAMLAAPRFEK